MEAFQVLQTASLQVQELNVVVSALEFTATKNFVIVQVADLDRVKGGLLVVSAATFATTNSNKSIAHNTLYAKEGQGCVD